MAFGLLQTLSACSDGNVAIDQVLRVFGSVTTIDPDSEKDLERFDDTYKLTVNNPANLRQRDHFRDAFRVVQSNYVTTTDSAMLVDAAIKGVEDLKLAPGSGDPRVVVEAALDAMIATLDPHSSYLNPEELRETHVITQGEFGGFGLEVMMDKEKGLIKVVSPIEDTPAFRAGILAGDHISHLDGESIGDMNLSQAVKRMRGRPGESIVLTIVREGQSAFDVEVVRAIVQIRSVRWRMEGDVAYVRIVSFTEKVEDKLEQAFAELDAQAGSNLKGVVLDLRNNPGGLLNQSLFVSDSFLDKGKIVSVRERDAKRNREFLAKPGDLSHGVPIVVLINEGSASASEIVAGALKDHHRALIMGRRSFGKGSVQTIQPLPLEGGLRLTTARYYSPSGHTIQARGVGPDIVLKRPQSEQTQEQKDLPVFPREADLPHALDGDSLEEKPASATLDQSACPMAGPKNDDRELGCALAYLHAGSTTAFLANIAQEVTAKPAL
ncbi:S41 family peptidase [Magnetovibrio blakemorei]|nr:S41 family peptidase [Magnetovibrio blakemorei]